MWDRDRDRSRDRDRNCDREKSESDSWLCFQTIFPRKYKFSELTVIISRVDISFNMVHILPDFVKM